jgi:hypothetical protein
MLLPPEKHFVISKNGTKISRLCVHAKFRDKPIFFVSFVIKDKNMSYEELF